MSPAGEEQVRQGRGVAVVELHGESGEQAAVAA